MRNIIYCLLALFGFSPAASAALIKYDTTGFEFTLLGVGQGSGPFIFSGIMFQFNPVASHTVNASPSAIDLFGSLVVSGTAGPFPNTPVPAGLGLRIKITESIPESSNGFIPDATFTGSISTNASSVALTWPNTNPIHVGSAPTDYAILNSPLGVSPPSINGGVTGIQGVVTAVPEPSSVFLVFGGVLALLGRRARPGADGGVRVR